ncbi:MAG: fibronectin type III domain-containing protein [Bacteroidetes bacterium QH_2_63_10]|nr:MAG: fibronectin type III domain-containing protein [Bacteroidetes bacterium QH_2_63_10]
MESRCVTAPPVCQAGSGRPDFPTLFLVVVLAVGLPACSGGGSNGGGNGNGPTAPAAPTRLSATSQDGAIGLDWEAVSSADSYRVYRSTSSGVDASGSPLDTGVGSADYVDDTAENGTKYYYAVTAVATEGGESAESSPSEEVEKTPFSDPPDRP